MPHRHFTLLATAICALLPVFVQAQGAQGLISWTASNFANHPQEDAPSFDSDFNDPLVDAGTLSRGPGLTGSDANSGVFGANGYSPGTNAAAARDDGSYWSFAVAPTENSIVDFGELSLNFGVDSGYGIVGNELVFQEGPGGIALGYSFSEDPATDTLVEVPLPGSTNNGGGSGSGTTSQSLSEGVNLLSWDLSFLQDIQTVVYFRLYIFDSGGGEGFIGSNGGAISAIPPDLAVDGTAMVVPEPAAAALLLGLATLAAGLVRRHLR